MNEILRHFVPQNDIGQVPVISKVPCSGEGEIPRMILAGSSERLGNEPAPRSALIGCWRCREAPVCAPEYR